MATPIAPPLGSVKPGELYVDLQSRTLWLGVDAAIDQAQAVLISNIQGASDLASQTLTQANQYTDNAIAQIEPEEPGNPAPHTHISSQITDFVPAVQAIIGAAPAGGFERGMILLWSGDPTHIGNDAGVADFTGWALCDGNNGTPNLRDRFVIGSGGSKPQWPATGSSNALGGTMSTNDCAPHSHVAALTALGANHLPAHHHSLAGGGGSAAPEAAHTHPVNINTDAQGKHSHVESGRTGFSSVTKASGTLTFSIPQLNDMNTSEAPAHQHLVNGNTGPGVSHTHALVGNTADVGGNEGHTHVIANDGVHKHTIQQTALRDGIPYYALAYIMKL